MIYQFELTYNGTTIIASEPVGWSNVQFIKRRDETYEGVFFHFSTEMQFYDIAYDFIMNAFNTDDIAADIDIVIKQKRVQWKAFDTFFTGKLLLEDLEYNDTHVTLIIEKGGVLRTLKNNIDKVVEITTNKTITLHSLPILYAAKFETDTDNNTFTYSKNVAHTPPFLPETEEIETVLIPSPKSGKNPIFYNGEFRTRTINLKGFISVQVRDLANNSTDSGVKLIATVQEVGAAYDVSNDIILHDVETTNLYYYHDITIDINIDVPQNYNLILFAESKTQNNLSVADSWTYNTTTSKISIKEELIGTDNVNNLTSEVKGVTFHEAFTQIASDIGITYTSTAMQEAEKLHNLLTNGYNIRRQNRSIKITFKQLFNIAKSLFKIGLVEENDEVVIKNLSDIYNTSILQTITNYSEPHFFVEKALAIAKIEAAFTQYKIQDTATLNFEYEFNTKRVYNSRNIKTSKPVKIAIDLIAAGAVIEAIRRRKNFDTNSYPEDEKLVLISLNRQAVTDATIYAVSTTFAIGTVAERNETLTVSNYEFPTRIMNARYTPRTIIENYLDKHYFKASNLFDFGTGEGNNIIIVDSVNQSDEIGLTPYSLSTPKRLEFVTDDILTSNYLQLSTSQVFIKEIREDLRGVKNIVSFVSV